MPEPKILIDEWIGCYRGGWKGVICDEAFSHPAKVAFNLARRIYEHAIEEHWIEPCSTVVDPFGGIGGCAFHGLMNGMIVVTNELEEKFVNLSKENRELWRKQYTGLPGFNADNWIILQGDSRELASVIKEAGIAVSSPPYVSGGHHTDVMGAWNANGGGQGVEKDGAGYGQEPGQLGAMKEGDLTIAISSPPYASGEKGHPSLGSVNNDDWGKDGRDITRRRGKTGEYGASDGQLGAMTEGKLCVSSPPFGEAQSGGGFANPKSELWDRLEEQHKRQFNGVSRRCWSNDTQGQSDGQLSAMPLTDFQAAISSPPYEGSEVASACKAQHPDGRQATYKRNVGLNGYGDNADGNLAQETPDTFWSASRTILEQLYSVLTPGAHAIFIVKSFVRNKQIVDFPGQWAQLCEAVGFKLIHDHHALLKETKARQPHMEIAPQGDTWRIVVPDKDYSVKRVSFFRRLHERRAPETEIFCENVMCFERP